MVLSLLAFPSLVCLLFIRQAVQHACHWRVDEWEFYWPLLKDSRYSAIYTYFLALFATSDQVPKYIWPANGAFF